MNMCHLLQNHLCRERSDEAQRCDCYKKKKKKTKKNKHNAELQQSDPGTKVTGEFSTRGSIFLPNARNGFVLFPSFWLGKIH